MAQGLPSFQESCYSLFRREPSNKERVVPVVLLYAGISAEEMWLQKDLFAWQPGLDELLAEELGENNISIHPILPGAQQSVECEHPCHCSRVKRRVAVTRVEDPGPGHNLPQAILTNLALSKQGRCGTHETGVMEGLHDWYSCLLTGVVGGRGDQRKSVVKMNDLRPFP